LSAHHLAQLVNAGVLPVFRSTDDRPLLALADLESFAGHSLGLDAPLENARPTPDLEDPMAFALPDDVRALLDAPNFIHLATVDRHGRPQTMAVWVGLDGDHLLVCTGAATQKTRNVEHQPHVAISVTDHENPYRSATLKGTVIEVRNDDELADMDPISVKYTGKPFPFRNPGRVTLVIAPESATFRELPFLHTPG
jgi:PPOX class probable F420-dependent enzyme